MTLDASTTLARTATVLTGIEDTEVTWRAVDYAVGLAQRQPGGARMVFVHVIPHFGTALLYPDLYAAVVNSASNEVRKLRSQLDAELAPRSIEWDYQCRVGRHSVEMLRAAREVSADVLVLGRDERAARASVRALAALLRDARLPVLVVP